MGHDHSHGHNHAPADFNKAFIIGIALNSSYILIEVIYGLSFNSLALLADAGHNLSDVLGLLIAWGASYLVMKKPTESHTYGFKKSSILAAFVNSLILLVAIGGIVWEAIGRFSDPQPIEGSVVMIVAGIGVIINTFTALLFLRGKENDINIKGAFLHMAADAAISLGVVIVGFLIMKTGILWLDPLVSIIIAIVIFFGTWSLLKESTNMALDAIPRSIDRAEVEKFLNSIEGVEEVHDLHIWAMSTTETALTAHLVMPNGELNDDFTSNVADELKHKHRISHATLQIENGNGTENCKANCC
ncbi:MAG: cation diffusion facilitator family transporter [Bacteroidetes bacterium]|nr:cation diffusion facilitator family transporter [Bacteroidota bacterium]